MKVEELLKSKNISYQERGNDFIIRCLNPEHEDNHPSLRIDKVTGVYHCFSCGYSGNLLLENNISTDIVSIKVLTLKKKLEKLKNMSLKIPLGAEPFFRDYRNISASTYYHFNAFIKSNDKLFEDRICFPITSIDGSIEVFLARRLFSDAPPKYLIIPENKQPPLFPQNPDSKTIVLVEGFFDMLNLWDKGVKNAVCCFGLVLGSSKRKSTIDKALKKFDIFKLQGVEKVYILFDGDAPGRKAAENLKRNLDFPFVETIDLPDNLDPGSMTVEQVKKLKDIIDD